MQELIDRLHLDPGERLDLVAADNASQHAIAASCGDTLAVPAAP
ncbi:MAG TPA: hypothetical protein VMW75_06460 [Thermoanaerobaculia bacterium]|nr:hypothetical protein [Thermoanaerobaculia bacterium]